MATVLTFACLVPMSANAATNCTCSDVPIVYIRGRADIVPDKTKLQSASNPALPIVNEAQLENWIKQLIPVYTFCLLTNNYDPFADKLAQYFAQAYSGFPLDANGNVTNNSGISSEKHWSPSTMRDLHKPATAIQTAAQASRELYRYYFMYDCRIDTFEIADDLNRYIESVKSVTGHSKVKVIARCFGSNVLSAYLSRYGWEDIEDVILYNPIMYGTDKLDCIFAGEIEVSRTSIDYIANNFNADTEQEENLKSAAQIINTVGGFDMTTASISKMANFSSARILRETYATCPGYWSMLSADAFVKAKDFVFKYYEEDYAGIIEKIDYYHENVRLKLDDIYSAMHEDGVGIYVIAKYGIQLLPIMNDPLVQSDDTVTVTNQVPGTVCPPLGYHFGDSYVNNANNHGVGKYISPDRQIDVSNYPYRDTTWFVKGLPHDRFPVVLDDLLYKILRSGTEYTVDTDSRYPQFLSYEEVGTEGALSKVTGTDPNYTALEADDDITIFLKKLQQILVEIFTKVFTQFILNIEI